MNKDITKVTSVNEAIKELGNNMLDNTCIQFAMQYATKNEDCIVECNKQISDVLVNYIKEERGMAEEYIKRSLSEQFDRTCYVLSASDEYNRLSICFSKENLRVDLHDSNGKKGDAYFVDEKYYPSDCYGFTKRIYMNNCFKKIDNTIKYVKPEVIIEKPVINYYISKEDLGIRKQIELFLKRDFNKIYDDSFICDFYNDKERIIDLGHKKYNYMYKMPEIVKKHIRILVEELRTMAKDTYVTLWDESYYCDEIYSIEEKMAYSRVPESLKEFQRVTNCEFEIIENFFELAFSDKNTNNMSNDIALVRVKDFYDYDGWYHNIRIASCNKYFINDYLKDAINECIELNCDWIKDIMIENGFKKEQPVENIKKKDSKKKQSWEDIVFNEEQFLEDNKGKPAWEDIKKEAIEKNIVQAEGNEKGKRYFVEYIGKVVDE